MIISKNSTFWDYNLNYHRMIDIDQKMITCIRIKYVMP